MFSAHIPRIFLISEMFFVWYLDSTIANMIHTAVNRNACRDHPYQKEISHYSHFHFIALCVNTRSEGYEEDKISLLSFWFIVKYWNPKLSYNNGCDEQKKNRKGIALHCVLMLSTVCYRFHVCRVFVTDKYYVTFQKRDWFWQKSESKID